MVEVKLSAPRIKNPDNIGGEFRISTTGGSGQNIRTYSVGRIKISCFYSFSPAIERSFVLISNIS